MPAIDTTRDTPTLPTSNVSLEGASGDGNDPATSDLERGFSKPEGLNTPPMGGMLDQKGGFLGRAKGWER